jgi:competence protein ComEA
MLSSFLNNYFGFNRQQRNGLFVLLAISFVLLLVRIIYPAFIKPAEISIQNLPLIERGLDSAYTAAKPFPKAHDKETGKTALFVFNPNTVVYAQLLALGFREKTAKIFLKFRSKGFVFKEKKDLQKIYGVTEKLYATLEPYIFIEPTKENLKSSTEKTPALREIPSAKPSPKIIDLNYCDSVALIGLSGIGPSYARRILKYGSMLGGYVSVEQLKEVYGFPEELFEKVKPFFVVTAAPVKKINLNTDDFKIINKHPYISYALTKLIFDWRRKTTITATNIKDILNDEALYKKMLPYLAFD